MEINLDTEELKKRRQSKAWSQAHLAEVAGISLRTVQRIEKSGIASAESAKSICAAYHIQLEDILASDTTDHQYHLQSNTGPTAGNTASFLKTENKIQLKSALPAFILAFLIAFSIAYLSHQ